MLFKQVKYFFTGEMNMPTSKNWKQKIEEQKVKYKENQAMREYKLKLAELKNERIYNDNQYSLKEKETEIKRLQSEYEHEEKVNEQKTQFIIRMTELYNEFIKLIIDPMTDLVKEQFNALKEVRQETVALLQNQINSTRDDMKKLELEKDTAKEMGENSLFSEISRQIRKNREDVETKEKELDDFIKTSWNDLNELVHRGIPLPSPNEFINNGNGLIGNQKTYLIE